MSGTVHRATLKLIKYKKILPTKKFTFCLGETNKKQKKISEV